VVDAGTDRGRWCACSSSSAPPACWCTGRQQPPRLGIFTTNALQRAILDGRPLDQLPVGELSNYPLVTVRAGRPGGRRHGAAAAPRASTAWWWRDGERIHGSCWSALDLFSFLANHSHLITVQIKQAQHRRAGQAAAQITRMIGRCSSAAARAWG
jgi:CBS domain-containing protein